MFIHQGRCKQRKGGSNGWLSNIKPLSFSVSRKEDGWIEQLLGSAVLNLFIPLPPFSYSANLLIDISLPIRD